MSSKTIPDKPTWMEAPGYFPWPDRVYLPSFFQHKVSLSFLSTQSIAYFNLEFLHSLKHILHKITPFLRFGDGSNYWKNRSQKKTSNDRCRETKVKQMQPMRIYLLSGGPFEDTFENTQWRKVKQMQPM